MENMNVSVVDAISKKALILCKGEMPMWKSIYLAFRDKELGDRFTYNEINNFLGFDIRENRSSLYIANNHLLEDNKKMLKNMRTVGYKIAEPKEQIDHASNRKKRAGRQLKKGILEVDNLDRSRMSQEEITRSVHLLNHMSLSLSVIRKRNVEAIKDTQKSLEKQQTVLRQIDFAMKDLMNLKKRISDF